jgi:glutamine kinase
VTKAFIIESEPGGRRLDPRQSRPRSLMPVVEGELSSLEWTLLALKESGIDDITYVGGYHIEKVIQAFPDLSFRYLRGEAGAEELKSLVPGDAAGESCLIIRATTVLRPGAVTLLEGAGAGVGTYESNGERKGAGVFAVGSAEWASLFDSAPDTIDSLAALDAALARAVTREVHLDGLAAPALDKSAVAAMILAGKAHTLDNLAPLSKKARVLSLLRFTVEGWEGDRAGVLSRIRAQFGDSSVVVRSSTVSEDSFSTSAAGQFLSLLDVDVSDEAALAQAIDDVIASFGGQGREIHPQDEVLVQPHLAALAASGVLLTRDPQHGSPYFVLNMDSASGRSDVVTSGGEGAIETNYLSWGCEAHTVLDAHSRLVLDAGRDLMRLSHFDALDIEFGLDAQGVCHLFQVRPLVCMEPIGIDGDEDILDVISHLHEFVAEASRPRPGILGSSNLLGNMSDWNPAEMIGAYPRPLALSLYQTLIGDHAWAEARARLGYRDMTSTPLILSLGGRPYVDIRTSLNSFLPADLDDSIGARWIDFCLDKLRADPPLHDKIEFEVAVTCMSPEWPRQRQWLCDAGLSDGEVEQFRQSLARHTGAMVEGRVEPLADQFAAIARLAERREALMALAPRNVAGLGRQLRQLVIDCTALGLVPFSIAARYGFVAMSLLRGLRYGGAIDEETYDSFLRAIPTVSGELAADTERLARREIDMPEMLARYGHLRPHSYDITSNNYAANPDQYFRASGGGMAHVEVNDPVELLMSHKKGIEALLVQADLHFDTETLACFMAEAIAGRERLKFEFMKSVDAILDTIMKIGACVGVSREELSFVPLFEFISLESNSTSRVLQSHLRRVSGQNEKQWMLAKALRLPDLIARPDDVYVHRLESWRPNFVTRKKVTAAPVLVDGAKAPESLDGAIVFIRAADPGFDWVFGHAIAGLVTQYGGVASHMAIRAAEFGLPAAIGCGEALFDQLSQAPMVELDCEHRLIKAQS